MKWCVVSQSGTLLCLNMTKHDAENKAMNDNYGGHYSKAVPESQSEHAMAIRQWERMTPQARAEVIALIDGTE